MSPANSTVTSGIAIHCSSPVAPNRVEPVGMEPLEGKSNFFYGNDPGSWVVGVDRYQEVWYRNLWDGVDLRYYTVDGELKYDFIVQPGSEISDIRVRYCGAEGARINVDGDIVAKNSDISRCGFNKSGDR